MSAAAVKLDEKGMPNPLGGRQWIDLSDIPYR
jgi:hypothetical protein